MKIRKFILFSLLFFTAHYSVFAQYYGHNSYQFNYFTSYPGPETPEGRALFEQAQDTFFIGDSEKGTKIFRETVASNPKAAIWFGEYFKEIRLYDLAEEAYLLHVKLKPKDKYAYLKLATVYKFAGEQDKAVEVLEQLIKNIPKDADAYIQLANTYKDGKKHAKVEDTYLRMIKKLPKSEDAYLSLGAYYTEQDELKKAEAVYQKFEAAIPGSSKLYTALGNYYDNLKDYNKAAEAYEEAVRLDPKDEHNFRMLTTFYKNRNRYEAVVSLYERMIKDDPSNANFYLQIATLYNDMGLTKKAEEWCKRLLKANPKDPAGYEATAAFYQRNGDYEKALAVYEDLTEIKKDIDTYRSIGSLLYSIRDKEKCIKAYERLLYAFTEYSIGSSSEFNSYSDRLAEIYVTMQQIEKAEVVYEEALMKAEAEGDQYRIGDVKTKLGDLYSKTGKYEAALKIYESTEGYNPKIPEMYIELGKYDKAEAYYLAHKNSKPESAKPYHGLAGLYTMQKKFDDAEKIYLEIIQKLEKGKIGEINTYEYSYGSSTLTNQYFELIQFYFATDQTEKVLLLWSKLINTAGQDDAYYYADQVSNTLISKNLNDKAIAVYKDYQKKYAEDTRINEKMYLFYKNEIRDYDKAVEYFFLRPSVTCVTDPYSNSHNDEELVALYVAAKRFDDAVLLYKDILEKYDSKSSQLPVALSKLLYRLKRHDEAIALFEKMIAKNPKETENYSELANYYKRIKQYDNAVATHEKLIAASPEQRHRYYREIASIYVEQEMPDKAVAYYLSKFEGTKEDHALYTALGNLYHYNMNPTDCETALKYYEKAFDLNSDINSCLIIAHCRKNNKKYEKALDWYQKALTLEDRRGYSVHYNIGMTYNAMEQYDKAIEAFKEELKNTSTNNITVYSSLAYSYAYKGDFESAFASVEKILTEKYIYGSHYYNIACIYSLHGSEDKALNYFEKALEKGFLNFDHIQGDKDLDTIKDTKQFKTLMKKYFEGKN